MTWLSHEGYTHIRFETSAAQRNFVYKDVVMDDPRYYTLTRSMEEWEYPS